MSALTREQVERFDPPPIDIMRMTIGAPAPDSMRPSPTGQWVKFASYTALRAQLAEMAEEWANTQKRCDERGVILAALRDCQGDPQHAIGVADKIIGEKIMIISQLQATLSDLKGQRAAGVREVQGEIESYRDSVMQNESARSQMSELADMCEQRAKELES